MTKVYRSYAKINLHLQVDGRFADGYHRLQTIFQSISLHDRIHIERAPGAEIELVVPDGGAPEDDSNLAHRAARAVVERWAPGEGLRIELHKRVPAGGGLGGGSSNAACVLEAVPEVLDLRVEQAWLRRAARSLGADVPFFLVGGTALGVGRGDEITPLPDLGAEDVVLVDPGVQVSTAEIFRELTLPPQRPLPDSILDYLKDGKGEGIAGLGGFNDLEETVLARVSEVRSVYTALRRAGASCVRLSGSGSTVFACFADARRSGEVRSYLPSNVCVYTVRTLSRSAARSGRSVRVDEGDLE